MNANTSGRFVAVLAAIIGMGLLFYVWMAVTVYSFSEWGTLWGLIALLVPPADLLMAFVASPTLGWYGLFGVILAFGGSAAYPED